MWEGTTEASRLLGAVQPCPVYASPPTRLPSPCWSRTRLPCPCWPTHLPALDPAPQWRFFWRLGERPRDTRYPELNAEPVVPAAFPEWRQVMDGWGGESPPPNPTHQPPASKVGLSLADAPAAAQHASCSPHAFPGAQCIHACRPRHPAGKMLGAVATVAEMAARGFGLEPDAFTSRMRHAPHLLAPTGACPVRSGSVPAYWHTCRPACLGSHQGLATTLQAYPLASGPSSSWLHSRCAQPVHAPPPPAGSDLSAHGALGTVYAGFHYDLNFLTIHGRSRELGGRGGLLCCSAGWSRHLLCTFTAAALVVVRGADEPPRLPACCRLPRAVCLAGRRAAHPRAHPGGLPPAAGELQAGVPCPAGLLPAAQHRGNSAGASWLGSAANWKPLVEGHVN